MSNLFDYLDWRGDISVAASPINEVDCLLLSWISYVNFEGIVPHEFDKPVSVKKASKLFLEKYNLEKILTESLLFTRTAGLALKRAAATERFSHFRLFGYRNVIDYSNDSQFAAVTFQIEPKKYIVVFRGTDDTIVGWKEDFNMCFMSEVPAQAKALDYLREVAAKTRGEIYVCGHSKGGNLAIYSACKVNDRIKKRIVRVYNFDGPGFGDETKLGDKNDEIFEKVNSYTPTESIVGMLLNSAKAYTVIRSNQKSIMQHDAASWQILGTHFVTADEMDEASLVFDETMKKWLKQMNDSERAAVIDAIFKILSANEAKSTTDIGSDMFKAASGMLKEYNSLSKESKTMLKKFTGMFIKEGSESIRKRRKENTLKLEEKAEANIANFFKPKEKKDGKQ